MSIVSDKPPTVNLKRVTISVTFCNGGRYGKRDCFGAAACGKRDTSSPARPSAPSSASRARPSGRAFPPCARRGTRSTPVTGRGYCLKSLPDTLTEQTVRSYLGPVETVGKRIDCFDSIDSTNAYLKRIALDGAPDGTVAVAAEPRRAAAAAAAAAFRARRARAFTCRSCCVRSLRRRS